MLGLLTMKLQLISSTIITVNDRVSISHQCHLSHAGAPYDQRSSERNQRTRSGCTSLDSRRRYVFEYWNKLQFSIPSICNPKYYC
jgi:hypothetical protein